MANTNNNIPMKVPEKMNFKNFISTALVHPEIDLAKVVIIFNAGLKKKHDQPHARQIPFIKPGWIQSIMQ
jgi:hypothetical protein